MPKKVFEEKVVYKYDELSDEAKEKAVEDYVMETYFTSFGNVQPVAETKLRELAEEELKESRFKHATVDYVRYDFSYPMEAQVEFSYKDINSFFLYDFTEVKDDILNEFDEIADRLGFEKSREELREIFSSNEPNDIFWISFAVKQGSSHNYELDYEVHTEDYGYGYSIYLIVKDWVYHHIDKSDYVSELEDNFDSAACNWFSEISNIKNFSNEDLPDYYNADGTFAGYEEDFD